MSAEESRPALLAMLRAHRGSPDECINHALSILREELAMDVAFVSSFRASQRWITHATSVDDTAAALIGTNGPAEETLCHLIARELTPALAPDIGNDPVLNSHPHRAPYNLGAYAGVPLLAGSEVVGAVCCASSQPHTSLNVRDESTLRTVSAYISEILTASSTEEPMAEADPGVGLGDIVGLVATGDSLERPVPAGSAAQLSSASIRRRAPGLEIVGSVLLRARSCSALPLGPNGRVPCVPAEELPAHADDLALLMSTGGRV